MLERIHLSIVQEVERQGSLTAGYLQSILLAGGHRLSARFHQVGTKRLNLNL
jgi:hypothetical protein